MKQKLTHLILILVLLAAALPALAQPDPMYFDITCYVSAADSYYRQHPGASLHLYLQYDTDVHPGAPRIYNVENVARQKFVMEDRLGWVYRQVNPIGWVPVMYKLVLVDWNLPGDDIVQVIHKVNIEGPTAHGFLLEELGWIWPDRGGKSMTDEAAWGEVKALYR